MDARYPSEGESATWMLRSRLQGWIHADPSEATLVAGADHYYKTPPSIN